MTRLCLERASQILSIPWTYRLAACVVLTLTSPAPVFAQADSVVGRVGNRTITNADLDRTIGNGLLQLRTQEYTIRRKVLDRLIEEYVLGAEAERLGISTRDLEKRLSASAKPPTPQEIELVFEATRSSSNLSGSEADTRQRIEAEMWQRRQSAARAEAIKALRGTYTIETLLDPPRLTDVRLGTVPPRGPESAAVTIVEYMDFQCPYCAVLASTLRQLLAKYPTKVRLVARDLPVSGHSQAIAAAEAARCAGDGGKYWAMHDLLFANRERLGLDLFPTLAAQVGLNPRDFQECLATHRHLPAIKLDQSDAELYSVLGTPTLFVNGRYLSGAVPLDVLARVIEEEIVARAADATKNPTR